MEKMRIKPRNVVAIAEVEDYFLFLFIQLLTVWLKGSLTGAVATKKVTEVSIRFKVCESNGF